MNNNTDCLHEACITDVRTVIHPTADSTAFEYIFRWGGSPELQHERTTRTSIVCVAFWLDRPTRSAART